MNKLILCFLKDNSGATAIEYALITVLISTAILTAAQTLGATLTGTFIKVAASLAP